jgi:hypothetical protein
MLLPAAGIAAGVSPDGWIGRRSKVAEERRHRPWVNIVAITMRAQAVDSVSPAQRVAAVTQRPAA